MKVFAVLALCFLAVNGEKLFTTLKDLQAAGKGKIIDGTPAAEGQFPWQVAVHFYVGSSSYFCGGALITQEHVLTAAHCADGATSFNLYFGNLGNSGGLRVDTTTATVHEGYNAYLNNDVAIIKMNSPIELTNNIQTIPLGEDRIGVDETLTVSGWGKTSDNGSVSPSLNYVHLRSIDNNECAGVYGSTTIIDSTLCCKGLNTNSASTCNGDSGGPLVKGGVHVGVVSFVHINGCASGNPSGYVRTASMRDWIKQHSGV